MGKKNKKVDGRSSRESTRLLGASVRKSLRKKLGRTNFPLENLPDLFWGKVKPGTISQCWEWCGGKLNFGHGRFFFQNRLWVASRLSYHILIENVPPHLCVLHKCDNPSCVNPRHLWLGTKKDNAIDSMKKGRHRDAKGEKNGRHCLTENQVREVISLHKGGETKSAIAKKFGIGFGTVGHITCGSTWKHLGLRSTKQRRTASTQQIKRIKNLRKKNYSQKRIADIVGFSQAGVGKILKREE